MVKAMDGTVGRDWQAAFDAAGVLRACGCRECLVCSWATPERWARAAAEAERKSGILPFGRHTPDEDDE